MNCINTKWDQELIRRLKNTGKSAWRSSPTSGGLPQKSDQSLSSKVNSRAGKLSMEEKLANKATREMEHKSDQMKMKLIENPFMSLRKEIMARGAKSMPSDTDAYWKTNDFQTKLQILDERTAEMKKFFAPDRKPHQKLPKFASSVNTKSTNKINTSATQSKKTKSKTSSPSLDDILSKKVFNRDPHYVEFSSLSSKIWSDICSIELGESIPIIMKSMRQGQWEKLIKYYGVFSRAGRLDRAILFEFANSLDEKMHDNPSYKDILRYLDPDPNIATFIMGKLIMNIYHDIVSQSGLNAIHLTIPQIASKLDTGYKTIMKVRKESESRSGHRSTQKYSLNKTQV